MRSVDTNVLVRLITKDDVSQVNAGQAFIEPGAWASTIAVAEAIWVLASNYELKPPALAAAIKMLLDHKHLTLQDADVIAAALEVFRKKPSLGFSDCLILESARKAGHLPLGTFDRKLATADGAHRI